MVGYNCIPTKRLRADARFPRSAGQAERRQPAQLRAISPSASRAFPADVGNPHHTVRSLLLLSLPPPQCTVKLPLYRSFSLPLPCAVSTLRASRFISSPLFASSPPAPAPLAPLRSSPLSALRAALPPFPADSTRSPHSAANHLVLPSTNHLTSSFSSPCSCPPVAPTTFLPPAGQGNAGSLQIQTTEHEVTTRQI